MMPDAEPIGTDADTRPWTRPRSDVVDLTDVAVADPTDAGPAAEPDAATDERRRLRATRSPRLPPADRRDRLGKSAAIVFIAVVVLGAAAVTAHPQPVLRRHARSRCAVPRT